MTLDEVINDLKYGELSKHGMFLTNLAAEDKLKLVSNINIGLLELYSRFPLLSKELTIIQKSWITEYKLDSKFAVSNPAASVKYILDTKLEPFIDDVIRVDGVYDEMGVSLLLNSTSVCKVALTPSMDCVEIPNPTDTNALFVIYRAKHPVVTNETLELLLPSQFKPALLAYVAHRIYSGGTAQEHVMLSTAMFQKYELFCTQQQLTGMTNQDDNEPYLNFCLGGWV